MTPAGFPHSDIRGSRDACSSPRLFAAYHVLRRRSVPRHPPCALVSLDRIIFTRSTVLPSNKHTHVRAQHTCFFPFDLDCQITGSLRRTRKYTSVASPLAPRSVTILFGAYRAYSRWLQKGGDPAAGSPTATLLRLRPSHQARLRPLCPSRVQSRASGAPNFHGVTGGVYKARERIHRGVADPRLLAIPASCSRVADCNPNLDRVFPIRSASRPRFGLSRPL